MTIHVYDKRIRELLYKFTGLIEEWCRSKLYDLSDEEECKKINKQCFSKTIKELKEANEIDEKVKRSLRKISNLRNEVCHHYLILIDSDGNKNLKTYKNIQTLYECLIDFGTFGTTLQNDFEEELKSELEIPMNKKYKKNKFKFINISKELPELVVTIKK